jgi:hypothetical protein
MIHSDMVVVEVERNVARKVTHNARGAIGRDVFSVLHYSKTHFRLGYFYRITIWACRLDLMLVVAKIQSVFQNRMPG